jgi:hypothetical protein
MTHEQQHMYERLSRLSGVAVPRLRPGQRGGLARRRSQQEEQADGDREEHDDDEEYLGDAECDPEPPPPGPHRPGRALALEAALGGV